MTTLYERYRPRQWSEVVGQDKAVKQLLAFRDRFEFGGQAFWISGQSGTGKTTIARLIAADVAESCAQWEFIARTLTAADLDRIKSAMTGRPIGGKGWCFTINEAHGLSRGNIETLLDLTETIPPYVTWCFTTSCDGQDRLFEDQIDACPLLSRFVRYPLARRDLCKPFAARCRQIAQAEGLDSQTIDKYERLAKECGNNMRDMLQKIANGAMLGGDA